MKSDYAAQLRRQAEAILNQQGTTWNANTAIHVSKILKELYAHHIELQAQYEDLQDAYSQLKADSSHSTNLSNFIPVGYVHLDINGFIREANQSAGELLKTSQKALIGKRLAEFLRAEDQPLFHFHLNKVFRERIGQIDELPIRCRDNTIIYTRITSQPKSVGGLQLCHTVISDITGANRHIVAQALQETALLLTESLDVTTVLERILEFVARVITCDVAFVALWGEQQQSLLLVQSYGVVAKSDLQGVQIALTPTLERIFETREPYIMAYKAEHESWPELIPNIQLQSYIVIPLFIRDERLGFLWVGSRQQQHFVQHHLQDLHMFARQAVLAVNNARQYNQSQKLATMNERQRIARELHDAVKQNLFSASLIAGNLLEHKSELSKELGQYADYLHDSLAQGLAEMRILMDELQPNHILDLPDADMLKALSNRLIQADIKVRIKTNLDIPILIPIKVNIYRILQEAITNIQNHANASNVRITLNGNAEQIDLVIVDDGIGFDSGMNIDGQGLGNMRQRVSDSQGNITIRSRVNKGTRIAISWRLAAASNHL